MRKTIVWFWNDLRLTDNPALFYASNQGAIIPIFIFSKNLGIGSAKKWWMYKSLKSLEEELTRMGGKLFVFYDDNELNILEKIIAKTKASGVYWNKRYEPNLYGRDKVIEEKLLSKGIEVRIFESFLLHNPDNLRTNEGKPYSIFTPFWRRFQEEVIIQPPIAKPEKIIFSSEEIGQNSIEELGLKPKINWYTKMENFWGMWNISENGAWKRLNEFIENYLILYKNSREYPYIDGTSLMSPYLAAGNISPKQIWYKVVSFSNNANGNLKELSEGAQSFLRQLAWREFSYHILYHNNFMVDQNLKKEFDNFPWLWEKDEKYYSWTKGVTGIPIIDAGMRQLWATGWMHNRVRMIVASYLTKNLLIHWKIGAEWFWDTLVDADIANNVQGWQWAAGCGADASPFFRIFNPILQSKKFDPEGKYIRRWIPELAKLPNEYIHEPWKAPKDVLKQAGIKLGEQYPMLSISLDESAKNAKIVYYEMKRNKKSWYK
ncbi:MAG: cryptochrome/photolyase family protein [Fervidobacterium sp.]